MAADRFLDTVGLRHLWEKIKAWIPFLSRKTQSIPFGQVDSSSTSTVFTATVDGIDELRDGVCCYLINGIVTSAENWVLNINNLGEKPVYSTMDESERITDEFNEGYTMLFVYNSHRIIGGCWDMFYGYDGGFCDFNNDFNNDFGFEFPIVGDGMITINQGCVRKGRFTVNQSGNTVIDLDGNVEYISGNGINISANHYISVKINHNQNNGLDVGGDGISMGIVTPSVGGVGGTNGAMLATDKEKLDNIETGAESNVQSDWNQSDVTADDYIKNKPEISTNNKLFINGHSGNPLFMHSLVATDTNGKMQPFTKDGGSGAKEVSNNAVYPIGCSIYYHPDSQNFALETDFTSKAFYSTFANVDARYTALNLNGTSVNIGDGVSSDVYLRVALGSNNNTWGPYGGGVSDASDIIVSKSGLIADNYYIYLGKTNEADASVQTKYNFQLESNHPLYFYDGTRLIPYANKVTPSSYYYKIFDSVDMFPSSGSATLTTGDYGQQIYFAQGELPPSGLYKVTMQMHVGWDSLMTSCILGVVLKFNNTNVSAGTYTISSVTSPAESHRYMGGTLVNQIGFLNLASQASSGSYMELDIAGGAGATLGGTHPLFGNIGTLSYNDYIIIERVGDYISPS